MGYTLLDENSQPAKGRYTLLPDAPPGAQQSLDDKYADEARQFDAANTARQKADAFKKGQGVGHDMAMSIPNALAGLVRGAGSIGATLLAPIDIVGDAIAGKGLTLASNRERRADIDKGLAMLGADPSSIFYKGGKLGAEVAGTAAVGPLLAAPLRSAGVAPELVQAIQSAGLRTGATPITGMGRAADVAVRATGGAITGGASAALTSPDHIGQGALLGAAMPPALLSIGKTLGYTGKAIKSFVEPFTESGRGAIVGRTLARFADDPGAIAAASGGHSITGALPTLAEATADSGIARLQDALRSVDPQLENLIGGRLAANNAARINTLQGIAKTPADREAAVAAVEAKAKDLYGQAFQENVDVTPALQRLAARPSVQKAEARAIQLARELGAPFEARLDDMRPKTLYAGMRDLPESGFTVPDNPAPVYVGKRALPDSAVIDTKNRFDPLTLNPQPVETSRAIPSGSVDMYIDLPPGLKDISVPSGRAGTFVDIPPVESVPVRDMHTLKMGMDALLSDPTLGIAGREAAAVMGTRNKLLDLLPDSYQVARQAHIEMNKPVNQIDIANRLLQTYSSATKDLSNNPTLRAEAFNRALQDEGKLIKQATGVKGIKRLADVMDPDQIAAIQGIADELSRTAAVAKVGNGPGAASAQRLASQNILQQALPSSWARSDLVQTAAKPLNMVYGGITDPKIQKLLADAMLNPNLAAVLARQQATSGASALERLLELPGVGQSLLRTVPVASDR